MQKQWPGKYYLYMRKKRKTGTETAYKNTQMSDWTDKDFKASIMNIFKELKEALLKEIKGGRMITFHQRERNYKKPNQNCGIEKNNYWNEVFTGGAHSYIWTGRS